MILKEKSETSAALISRNLIRVPNIFIQSPLFSVTRNGDHEFMKRQHILAPAGSRFIYTGPRLSQKDFDVWLACIRLTDGHFQSPIRLFLRKTLRILNIAPAGKSSRAIRESLLRLNRAHVSISYKNHKYEGKMIEGLSKSTDSNHLYYSLDPNLIEFGIVDNSNIDLDQRFNLGRNELAKWLFAYISTQPSRSIITLDEFHDMCGSRLKCMYSFKRKIINVLERVSDITGYSIEIISTTIIVEKSQKHPDNVIFVDFGDNKR